MVSTCRICNNANNNVIHQFEENMFGTGEKFNYLECGHCMCLQLMDPPSDISKYYPEEYSNYKPATKKRNTVFLQLIKEMKVSLMLNRNWMNIPGLILRWIAPEDFVTKLSHAKLSIHNSLLDLGAGNGERILRLNERGFKNVKGIDPYIGNDIYLNEEVKIIKQDLSKVKDMFDFVMLNHSFEHMNNPDEILLKLNKLIRRGNYIMIRIPVAGSYSWNYYKENWVALDPPRHYFLHTPQSIQILASRSGFQLDKVVYDSMEYQFIGSEQLKRGIKLHDENSYYVNKTLSIFSERDILRFKKKARKLNRRKEGDAACFFLKKVEDVSAK